MDNMKRNRYLIKRPLEPTIIDDETRDRLKQAQKVCERLDEEKNKIKQI